MLIKLQKRYIDYDTVSTIYDLYYSTELMSQIVSIEDFFISDLFTTTSKKLMDV